MLKRKDKVFPFRQAAAIIHTFKTPDLCVYAKEWHTPDPELKYTYPLKMKTSYHKFVHI